jgi:hypothetical protein
VHRQGELGIPENHTFFCHPAEAKPFSTGLTEIAARGITSTQM